MRDPIRTRRLLAKIDREIDIYVVADRMRQAIYDLDDYTGDLEKRIHALEIERTEFLKESGVHRIIESTDDKQTTDAFRVWRGKVLGGVITAGIGFLSAVLLAKCTGH